MSYGPLSDLSHLTWRRTERMWFRVAGAVITVLVFSAGFVGTWMAEGDELGPVGCLYATMGESTDEQIARLIREP